MQWIAATKNSKKRDELVRILEPLGVSLLIETDLSEPLPEVEETGSTFAENAALKAISAMEHTGLPAIADDSGLCVDALDGAPGVYSARYAGEGHDDQKNNEKLLRALEGVPMEKRGAYFACAICCVFPDGRRIETEGRADGTIGFVPACKGGFGYDPLFFVGEKSFAQLTAEEKDAVSHRGKALRALREALRKEFKDADK